MKNFVIHSKERSATGREDQTAPISQQEIEIACKSAIDNVKLQIVHRVLQPLNEKRDAYNGIVTSIIYIIDSQDQLMLDRLSDGLISFIVSRPMKFGGKVFVTKALTRLTSERPLFVEDLFERIVNTSYTWSKQFKRIRKVYEIEIIAIKAIRNAEESRGGRPTKLSQDTIDHICTQAIYFCDESTKIDTLNLVLASRSTTKVLEGRELTVYRRLMQDALALEQPALRQMFIAQTNKLLKRLKDSHRVVMRDKKKYSDLDRKQITKRYREFLSWLVEFCFGNVFCNSYFGSFVLTITTLKLVIQHITFSDDDLQIFNLFNQRFSYDTILNCLSDSFEENKSLALELLLKLPHNDQFHNSENIKRFQEIAYDLVGSVSPAHSLTCQYIFKLVIGLEARQSGGCRNEILHFHLTRLIESVEEGIRETCKHSVLALRNRPIYPKLTCIRSLLEEVNINELGADRRRWRILTKRIVASSIEACAAVSTIVCNLNPETIGHLPMDLKPIDSESLSKMLNVSLNISEDELSTITSQMLLISGWKTIKECSLSLGTMCVRFWWPSNKDAIRRDKFPGLEGETILESSDITDIVKFFEHYLRNLRHRGAFEQAYNGFIMVTRRIWHEDQFRSLLSGILAKIMSDFSQAEEDVEKADKLRSHTTRRSAGLPFVVQAILISEPRAVSESLELVTNFLFSTLENPKSDEYQRIHCLNILKAVIKEHDLGEKVLPYVGRTLAVTLDAFRFDSFPIRNCANMLLKAVVDRTFGVNRLRDDIHRRNQLSFEKFFTEYPDLPPKMLKQLTDGIEEHRYLAAVHAVFILLFRLRPSLSPSESFNIQKTIRPFIAPIFKLALTCPDQKLRELAAQLVVRLEIFSSPTETIEPELVYLPKLRSIIFELRYSLANMWNEIHGALLLTKSWIDEIDYSQTSCQHSELMQFAHSTVLEICLSSEHKIPIALKSTALDLAESCLLKDPSDSQWILNLWQCCQDLSRNFSSSYLQAHHLESVIFKCFNLLIMSAAHQPDVNIDLREVVELMVDLIVLTPNKVISVNLQAALLRFLRQIFDESESFATSLLDKLDCDLTVAHVTPFDRLKAKIENDSQRDRLVSYCNIGIVRRQLSGSIDVAKLFRLHRYDEFKRLGSDTKFSPGQSNTLRSIELLALAITGWDQFQLGKRLSTSESRLDSVCQKINFFNTLLSNLPDCDVKCLALLCAGRLMEEAFELISNERANNDLANLQRLSEIINELAEGDRSLSVRETCVEVLRLSLRSALSETGGKLQQECRKTLLSSLIKLSQDEDREVRVANQEVIESLEINSSDSFSAAEEVGHLSSVDCSTRSRLDHLIKVITCWQFDSGSVEDIILCYELLLRIIFNQSSRLAVNLDDERTRLFDKTKLNIVADQVVTMKKAVHAAIEFSCQYKKKGISIELGDLRVPQEVLRDLSLSDFLDHADAPDATNKGDYSWRLKRLHDGGVEEKRVDLALVAQVMQDIIQALKYLSGGYKVMLTDTDFTYHQLALLRRLIFLRFMSECTNCPIDTKSGQFLEMRLLLEDLTTKTCSTNLLCECHKQLESIS